MKTVTIDQLTQKKSLMHETKSKTPFSGVSLSYLKFLEQVLWKKLESIIPIHHPVTKNINEITTRTYSVTVE